VAGKTPFFLTGGNARILLNNRTVAYATNVTYKVSVKHATPRVLGRFEVEVIQPLTYDVTGTLSIIRYGRGLESYFASHAPESVNNKGNSVGSYGLSSFGGALGGALGLPTPDGQFDGSPDDAFNPSRFFQSKMFNIEIRQKVPSPGELGKSGWNPKDLGEASFTSKEGLQKFGQSILDTVNDVLVKDKTSPGKNETSVILLRDCRFEDMSFRLDKRGAATIDLTFRARYADGDDVLARKSGVGQELS
jgi:hypothetical protein